MLIALLRSGGHTQVSGATAVKVTAPEAAAALVRKAAQARACEATAMNAVSSRSHSVFMLNITGKHAGSATCLRGALNLVDLAGRCLSTPVCTLSMLASDSMAASFSLAAVHMVPGDSVTFMQRRWTIRTTSSMFQGVRRAALRKADLFSGSFPVLHLQ